MDQVFIWLNDKFYFIGFPIYLIHFVVNASPATKSFHIKVNMTKTAYKRMEVYFSKDKW